ncbi:alpha/beta hydrolase [Novosphingobium beihaiensis]|uniref:Alpha/beta hydrolase n=1 Tax=Novosphingobium beihaiensis TaxID=2930389 RepID=A0ABT0BQ72_9SPHN|nr:alpha/beta hydrolase [Novosphingobium beihaiensis]MCJ2187110.1 alpha/beta hydrolase [Novosphingobium beihaiensis]
MPAFLLGAAGLYAIAILALYLGQRAIIYPAPGGPVAIPAGFEKVHLKTGDGLTLTAAWHPARSGKRTVLFFHGNGDTLPGAAAATRGLAEAGYGVLLADYRGYAGNPGKPTEAGLIMDGKAAEAFLSAQGIKPESVILMGASLGTGIATQLAADRTPAALVLVSPFTSLADAGAAALPWAPVRLLMHDQFKSRDVIADMEAPVLVLHGADDRVIPFKQGRALANAAPHGEFLRFDGNGHQLQFTAQAQDAIVQWLVRKGL